MTEIRFGAVSSASQRAPSSARSTLPAWYRETEVYGSEGRGSAPTVKRCAPFRDAMTAGYLLPLQTDVCITRSSGRVFIESTPRSVLSAVGRFNRKQLGSFPGIPGFDVENVLKWINPWTIQTPPGYSVRVSHPVGHHDSGFRTFDAVVDTDSWVSPVNFAFLLEADFEGVIPAGTPIAQIHPFKREAWEHSVFEEDVESLLIRDQEFKRDWEASYQNRFRMPKTYQ